MTSRRAFLFTIARGIAVLAIAPAAALEPTPIAEVWNAWDVDTLGAVNSLLKEIYAPMVAEWLNLRVPLQEFFR